MLWVNWSTKTIAGYGRPTAVQNENKTEPWVRIRLTRSGYTKHSSLQMVEMDTARVPVVCCHSIRQMQLISSGQGDCEIVTVDSRLELFCSNPLLDAESIGFFIFNIDACNGFLLYPVQCSLVVWLCLVFTPPTHSVCLAQFYWPLACSPCGPWSQWPSNIHKHWLHKVCLCVTASSSEPEEVAVWKEASSSCLVSFFVCAVNTLKMFLLLFVCNPVRMLVMLLSYYVFYFESSVVVVSNP